MGSWGAFCLTHLKGDSLELDTYKTEMDACM